MGLDNTTISVKVMATGVIALCLVLAAILSLSSAAYPAMQDTANRFFDLAVLLIAAVVGLALVRIKIKMP
jgi:hypothetical protein